MEHIDLSETPQNLPPDATTAPTSAATVAAPAMVQAPAKPRKTIGEKIFDWGTYGGLNGVGTFLLTIPLADWGNRKIFDSWSKGLNEKFKIGPNTATNIVKSTTLAIGGTVMLLPVYLAERNKKPISEWLNQKFGNHEEKKAQVENPAPQTPGSLIKGRLLAWCAVFLGFKSMEWMGKGEALQKFEQDFGKKTCAVLGKLTHVNNVETTAFRWGKLAALDIFATAAATSILYVTSHVFAKQQARAQKKPSPYPVNISGQLAAARGDAITLTESVPQTAIQGEKTHPGVVVAPTAVAQHSV